MDIGTELNKDLREIQRDTNEYELIKARVALDMQFVNAIDAFRLQLNTYANYKVRMSEDDAVTHDFEDIIIKLQELSVKVAKGEH